MNQRKALDVTTKGWSISELQEFTQKINEQNYGWKANVITQDGQKKFCYFYSKVDLEIISLQKGFKILKVVKL